MSLAFFCFAIAAILLTIAFADDLKEFATNVRTAYKLNAETNKGSALDLALDTIGTTRQIYASAKVEAGTQYPLLTSPFAGYLASTEQEANENRYRTIQAYNF